VTNPSDGEISVNEVIEELDPLGKALFDAALLRVRLNRAQAEIAELKQQGAHRAD
jgi:hypothetical protein